MNNEKEIVGLKNENASYILWNGNRPQIKRKLFEMRTWHFPKPPFSVLGKKEQVIFSDYLLGGAVYGRRILSFDYGIGATSSNLRIFLLFIAPYKSED